MNGVLVFGLSTAFLFAMLERIWVVQSDAVGRRREHWADIRNAD